MSMFLDLDVNQRRNAIAVAADRLGIAAVSIEKDYVVCRALRVLYSMPDARDHVTFKGGTSLSKGYGLIHRFSEDVDLVVDRELIGADPEPNDMRASSLRARSRYVKNIQKCLERWIEDVAIPHFSNAPTRTDGSPLWRCRVDDASKHRDTLLLEYDSVLDGPTPSYIRPSVKLEFGARADKWPAQIRDVQSYVVQQFPEFIQEEPLSVVALSPERTFLEKLCLVHEEVTRTAESTPRAAQSRHFYDLFCLIEAGYGERAISDAELFNRVVEHRELYFHRSGVDYKSMRRRSMQVVPRGNQLTLWEQDYELLRENMIIGDAPEFGDIIACIDRFASNTLQ